MIDIPTIRVFDAIRAMAFVGDLSMGQPTDHSIRTAWIADRIAFALGYVPKERSSVRQAALLRWSGCTANAGEFAELLGDDVAGREAMLASRPDWSLPLDALGGISATLSPLVQINCDVSGEVARSLGLDASTERTLRNIFESYDGQGLPGLVGGRNVPHAVFIVTLAGDIEIFGRVYGVERALALVAHKANRQYPEDLVRPVASHVGAWLRELDTVDGRAMETCLITDGMRLTTQAELIADVIDLKLP